MTRHDANLNCCQSQWTDELVVELRRLWGIKGLTAQMIGDEMGVSRNAAIGKAHRLGLPLLRSESLKGEDHPNWKGGKAAANARHAARQRERRAMGLVQSRAPRKPKPTEARAFKHRKLPGRLCFLMGFRSQFT